VAAPILEAMAFVALIDHTAPASPVLPRARPSLGVRLCAFVHRFELTQRLAECADPNASPELALRARQLATPRELRRTILGLERVLREAAQPSRAMTSQVPLQRQAILAARPFLVSLLDTLREVEHPQPAGLARAELLLTDGAGPVYAPSYPGTLASLAFRARQAL
jgi:hypothetical protein